MTKAEMFVRLVIPDNIAITTKHCLERMGYKTLIDVKREDYFCFDIEGNEKETVENLGKTDILVNANKNRFRTAIKEDVFRQKGCKVCILVKNIDEDTSSLLSTLKNRLGFKNICDVEKGVLWTLFVDEKPEQAKKTAEDIANNLLVNKHYQEFEILSKTTSQRPVA